MHRLVEVRRAVTPSQGLFELSSVSEAEVDHHGGRFYAVDVHPSGYPTMRDEDEALLVQDVMPVLSEEVQCSIGGLSVLEYEHRAVANVVVLRLLVDLILDLAHLRGQTVHHEDAFGRVTLVEKALDCAQGVLLHLRARFPRSGTEDWVLVAFLTVTLAVAIVEGQDLRSFSIERHIPTVLLIYELDRGLVHHHAEAKDALKLCDELECIDHVQRGLCLCNFRRCVQDANALLGQQAVDLVDQDVGLSYLGCGLAVGPSQELSALDRQMMNAAVDRVVGGEELVLKLTLEEQIGTEHHHLVSL